jgi:S-adenosylmethionine hydrolase
MDFASPSGVITLTTDFGLEAPFVGVMKGRILGRFAAARIVDLTHDILVHWPAEAGFWLERSWSWFPAGTVHVAVVDPGVGTDRDILIATAAGHVLLAPDNGLLAPLLARSASARVRRLDSTVFGRFGIGAVSATFHGRDIFAPLAAELAAGRCDPADLGALTTSWVPSWVEEPDREAGAVTGIVITIDRFGNLLTNIGGELLEGLVEPRVFAGHHVFPLRRTYGDVRPGEYLALVNSFGVVELALAEGSAADGLGLSRGAPVVVRDAVRHN